MQIRVGTVMKENEQGQALVAHYCNPCYSVGRDQEDHSLRPVQAKSKTLSQKYPKQKKRADGVTQMVEHTCLASMSP
jgi:hypothetical protein